MLLYYIVVNGLCISESSTSNIIRSTQHVAVVCNKHQRELRMLCVSDNVLHNSASETGAFFICRYC